MSRRKRQVCVDSSLLRYEQLPRTVARNSSEGVEGGQHRGFNSAGKGFGNTRGHQLEDFSSRSGRGMLEHGGGLRTKPGAPNNE